MRGYESLFLQFSFRQIFWMNGDSLKIEIRYKHSLCSTEIWTRDVSHPKQDHTATATVIDQRAPKSDAVMVKCTEFHPRYNTNHHPFTYINGNNFVVENEGHVYGPRVDLCVIHGTLWIQIRVLANTMRSTIIAGFNVPTTAYPENLAGKLYWCLCGFRERRKTRTRHLAKSRSVDVHQEEQCQANRIKSQRLSPVASPLHGISDPDARSQESE